jgi:hypothetical protein
MDVVKVKIIHTTIRPGAQRPTTAMISNGTKAAK